MTDAKTTCYWCGDSILQRTADAADGLCLPCYKAENQDRTPDEVRGIRARGDDVLEGRWQTFRATSFPSTLGGREVDGVCVTLLDADVARLVDGFLGSGDLNADARSELRLGLMDLEGVCAALSGEEARYFEMLHRLANDVLTRLGG